MSNNYSTNHSVIDSDILFHIDPFTRQITSSDAQKNILMRGDHHSECFTFEMPRYIEGHDMSLCNSVMIHFINSEVSKKKDNAYISGVDYISDLKVSDTDDTMVTFSWLIDGNATIYAGVLKFGFTFKCLNGTKILYSWGTDVYDGIKVLDSIGADLSFEIDHIDAIAQWKDNFMAYCFACIATDVDHKGEEVKRAIVEYVDNETRDLADDINALESRMNTFTSLPNGSTTGDAELIDSRIDHTGKVWDNLGAHVRGVTGRLSTEIVDVGAKKKRNIYTMSNGDVSEDGSITTSETYGVTDLIDVKFVKNNDIIMESGVTVYIAQYKEDNSFISITKYSQPSLIALDSEAKYIRLNSKLINDGKFYIAYTIVSKKDMEDRFKTIANISQNLSITTDLKSMFISEKNLDNNGNEVSDPSWSVTDYLYARVVDCSKYVVNAESCVLYIYLYDKNKNFIERIDVVNTIYVRLRSDCEYIRLCTKTVNITFNYFDILSVSKIATLSDIDKNVGEKSVLSLDTTLDYGAFDDDGKYISSTWEKVTPRYIKVSEYTQYMATFVGNLFCFEYDKDKNLISNTELATGTMYGVNAKTRYVRFASAHNPDWTGTVEFENLKQIEFAYNEREGYETLPFIFQFHGNKGLDYGGSNVDVDTKPYYAGALLRLPPNYSSVGDKVPLIYFAHGSGDYLDRNDTEFSKYYMDYIRYLQDEGFAVCDINGNTSKYTTTGACQWGNPTNMSAIKQGIRWVCTNYNVDINRVYVMSKSLGGLQAINMCYENDLHIKACCPLAPELDMLCDGLGYYPNERKNNADDLGFSEDVNHVLDTPYDKSIERLYKKSDEYKQYIRDNASKLLGHNPAWRGVIGISASEMVEYPISGDYVAQGIKMETQNRYCAVPTKIFIAPDDTAVSYEMSKGYIQSLKNGGCVGELRTMPSGTGGHHAVDNAANALKVSEVKTFCGVTHYNVPLAYIELVQFFKRYS